MLDGGRLVESGVPWELLHTLGTYFGEPWKSSSGGSVGNALHIRSEVMERFIKQNRNLE